MRQGAMLRSTTARGTRTWTLWPWRPTASTGTRRRRGARVRPGRSNSATGPRRTPRIASP
eukprot:1267471-Alexandrium_andersonii.AAC.1